MIPLTAPAMIPPPTFPELMIIGFASVIGDHPLPRYLPPVYQRTNGDVIFPPFEIAHDRLLDGHVGNMAEMEEFVAKQKATLFDTPLQAYSYHSLWVDAKGVVSHDPNTKVVDAFKRIYLESMRLANIAFEIENYECVTRQVAIARSVNTLTVDPLVIRGACEIVQDNMTEFAFTKHIAEDLVSGEEFERRTSDYIVLNIQQRIRNDRHRRSTETPNQD